MWVTTTHGFPHGNHATPIKVAEARQALADGATAGAIVKVVFGSACLTDAEKVTACRFTEPPAPTSSRRPPGSPSGATHDDLRLVRANASPHVQVKAAGSVWTLDAPIAVMNLGVTRIGAAATEAVILDFRARRNGDGPAHQAPVDAGRY